MALNVTKTYATGEVLFEADLDAIKSSIETYYNTTGIDDDVIQDGSITASTKFINATVTAGVLAPDSIGSSQLAADSVTTAKIADSAVTAAKLAANAVTRAKLAATNLDYSDEFNDATIGLFANEVIATKSFTTTGRPVLVSWAPDTNGLAILWGHYGTPIQSSLEFSVTIKRASTVIARFPVRYSATGAERQHIEIPSTAIWTIDLPAAGTYTYELVVHGGTEVGVHENQTVGYQGRLMLMEIQ